VDLAVSPNDPDVLVVANQYGVGVRLTLDSPGSDWNDTLANLPVQRLLSTPSGTRGQGFSFPTGTRLSGPRERSSRGSLCGMLRLLARCFPPSSFQPPGGPVNRPHTGSTYSYAGAADGRIWVSLDGGEAWQLARLGEGAAVVSIYSLPTGSNTVFAGFGEGARRRIARSRDGGVNWEDLTSELPGASLRGLAVDPGGTALLRGYRQRGLLPDSGVPARGVARAVRESPGSRSDGCEARRRRQSGLCGGGWIRGLCGSRSAPVHPS